MSDFTSEEEEAVTKYRQWIQSEDMRDLPQNDSKFERFEMMDQAVHLNYNQLVDTIKRRATDAMPNTIQLFNKI